MRNPTGTSVQDLRLVVSRDPRTKEAVVTAENRPDLGAVRDRDQRVAIQEFRSKADRSTPDTPTHWLPGENRDR